MYTFKDYKSTEKKSNTAKKSSGFRIQSGNQILVRLCAERGILGKKGFEIIVKKKKNMIKLHYTLEGVRMCRFSNFKRVIPPIRRKWKENKIPQV